MPDSVYLVILNRALQAAHGNHKTLAEALGVSLDTLRAWMREEGTPSQAQLRAALEFIGRQ